MLNFKTGATRRTRVKIALEQRKSCKRLRRAAVDWSFLVGQWLCVLLCPAKSVRSRRVSRAVNFAQGARG
jgi:hypothetical protein